MLTFKIVKLRFAYRVMPVMSLMVICTTLLALKLFSSDSNIQQKCHTNVSNNQLICRPDCSAIPGHFSLPGMKSCHPWLTCKDSISIQQRFASGYIKQLHFATWKGYRIAYNKLKNRGDTKLLRKNLQTMKQLQPSPYITQLIGFCNDTFLTEYYPNGELHKLESTLRSLDKKYRSTHARMTICINFVKAVDFLHNSPMGVLMMCDSTSIRNIMKQFLVADDLTVVANDLDRVPVVDPVNGTICNLDNKHMSGSLMAPEQYWPYNSSEQFDPNLMPKYNEKADIWKIPDVCNKILKKNLSEVIPNASIINRCKDNDPSQRPSAKEVLQEYYRIRDLPIKPSVK